MFDQDQKDRLAKLIRETAGPVVDELVQAKWGETAKEIEGGRKALTDVISSATRQAALATDPREQGKTAARLMWCVARAHKYGGTAEQHAKEFYGEDQRVMDAFAQAQKALAAEDFESGGAFITETVADEIIELLRAASVVRRLGVRTMPNPSGTLRIRKLTSGATANYIGEQENITPSEAGTGAVIAQAKKLAVLTPISNDLLRRADPRTETLLRDDMVEAMRNKEDITFIRGPGSAAEPKGMYHWAAAANLLPATNHDPASLTLAQVTTDLGRCLRQLMEGNVPMTSVGWIFTPRTFVYLVTIRDGNGNLVFKPEMDSGRLFGFPFAWTTQIPQNLDASGTAGNDESEMYFVDFAQIVLADTMNIELSAHEAAYHDGSQIQSAVSLDETVIRGIAEHDLVARHAEAIVVLEQVVWGA